MALRAVQAGRTTRPEPAEVFTVLPSLAFPAAAISVLVADGLLTMDRDGPLHPHDLFDDLPAVGDNNLEDR